MKYIFYGLGNSLLQRVARGEAVLQCVCKIWIKSVADSGLSICDTIVFCPWIALSYNRNT